MEQGSETMNSLKRAERGASSRAKNCAECRRLKIKCDRQVPCANCVKRGTASICPDGQLLPKGQRLILASTEDLHGKIDELTERIRELEEALAALQAQYSDEPHPLLSNPDDLPITSFGSLMIREDGNVRFFGATSTVEWPMMMQDDGAVDESLAPEHPEPVSQASQGDPKTIESITEEFPLPSNTGAIKKSDMMERAIAELPRRERAVALVDCYYLRASWQLCPVTRQRLVRDYFAPCYEKPLPVSITLQDFGLLYSVFALGMIHNPEVPNHGQLAAKYTSLSRACLAVGDFITNTSLSAVDALLLGAGYHYSADDPAEAHKGTVLIGVALKLAVGIGLHREPSMWGLPEEECARRRKSMWELVSCELWGAMIAGRPPMLSRQHFDVKLPLDLPDGGDSDPNFSRGKHHFSEMCLWQVLDLGLASSKKATYAAVLKVDTKIRRWDLPKVLQTPGFEPIEEEQTITNFRQTLELIFKEITLLCLHRSYFACALLEPPFDPLGSPFSRSVLAAYGSACAILGRVRSLYSREPIIIMRFSFFWTHAFSAAVILASITIRAPDCTLAPTALMELNSTVEMFKRAQAGYNAGRGLPTLIRLQSKAHAAFDSYRSGTWTKPTSTDTHLQRGLGGSAAIVSHVRTRPVESPPAFPPLASHQIPERAAEDDVMSSLETVQPSLEEYLRSFGFDAANAQVQAYNGGAGGGDGNRVVGAGDTGMFVPSSDAFLQGVLTGHWGDPPPSEPHVASVPGYQLNMPPLSAPASTGRLLDPRDQRYPLYDEARQHQAHITYRPSPPLPSDGSQSSTMSGGPGTGLDGTYSQYPPPLLHQLSPPTFDVGTEDSQASFLWDIFLRELGVQGAST